MGFGASMPSAPIPSDEHFAAARRDWIFACACRDAAKVGILRQIAALATLRMTTALRRGPSSIIAN